MKLKVEVEDNIYIENENGDQLLCIEMGYDIGEVLKQLEILVEYLNNKDGEK